MREGAATIVKAMSATLSVELPDELRRILAERAGEDELPRWALESIVLEAVRDGILSRGRGGELLGLGFHEREALYARRGLVYSYGEEDLAAERKHLEALLAAGKF